MISLIGIGIATLLFVLATISFVLLVLSRSIGPAGALNRAVKLMFEGQYDRSLRQLENLATTKREPGILQIMARFNIAAIQSRLGNFSESLDTLDQIQAIQPQLPVKQPNIQWLLTSVQAANLILLNRDLDLARALLQQALSQQPQYPTLYLYLAYLELQLGQLDAASSAVQDFFKHQETLQEPKNITQFFAGVIKLDYEYQQTTDGFLLGHFYLASGDRERAEYYLIRAAAYPYRCFYKAEASRTLNTF